MYFIILGFDKKAIDYIILLRVKIVVNISSKINRNVIIIETNVRPL